MMILDPLSIATGGYVGAGPSTDFCPLPLAIASDGYIRFEVDAVDRRDGDGGHGAVIMYPPEPKPKDKNLIKLATIAIIAIEENYE